MALKTREIREMNLDDRSKALTEARGELMHERGLAAMGGAVKNPGKIRDLRTTIARILTIQHAGELGIAGGPKASAPAPRPKPAAAAAPAARPPAPKAAAKPKAGPAKAKPAPSKPAKAKSGAKSGSKAAKPKSSKAGKARGGAE